MTKVLKNLPKVKKASYPKGHGAYGHDNGDVAFSNSLEVIAKKRKTRETNCENVKLRRDSKTTEGNRRNFHLKHG